MKRAAQKCGLDVWYLVHLAFDFLDDRTAIHKLHCVKAEYADRKYCVYMLRDDIVDKLFFLEQGGQSAMLRQ